MTQENAPAAAWVSVAAAEEAAARLGQSQKKNRLPRPRKKTVSAFVPKPEMTDHVVEP